MTTTREAPPDVPASPRGRDRPRVQRARAKLLPYLLVLPGGVFVLGLLLYPVLDLVVSSFFEQGYGGLYDREFVGLEQFGRLLGDEAVLASFGRTVTWVVSVTLLSYTLGLGIALVLNRRFAGRGAYRGMILVPWAVPFVAAAFAWQSLYDTRYGVLNHVLQSVGLIDEPVSWLGSPATSLWSVVAIAVWKQIPFAAVTLLAALQRIDHDLYGAAAIDGCGPVRAFRYITLPGIRGVSIIVLTWIAIWTYNQFDLVYLTTGGGPAHSSEIISIFTYLSAFSFGDLNYAAAIGVVGLLLLSLLIVPVARTMARTVHR